MKARKVVALSVIIPGGFVILAVWLAFRAPKALAVVSDTLPKAIRNAAMRAAALLPGRQTVRDALRTYASSQGIDPDIADAIGWVESRWKLSALNNAGPDALRGGSWGPTSISEKTARAYGYTGDMQAFREDPNLAAEWTAKILAARPGGPPATPEEATAWWNAGKISMDDVASDSTARTDYLPALQNAYDAIA